MADESRAKENGSIQTSLEGGQSGFIQTQSASIPSPSLPEIVGVMLAEINSLDESLDLLQEKLAMLDQYTLALDDLAM